MSRPRHASWSLVAALLLGVAAAAQSSARAEAERIGNSPHVRRDRLWVKLAEGTGAELCAGRLRSRTGADLARTAASFTRARAEPLFTALSWDELDAWHRRAAAALGPERAPGHLGLWFSLSLSTPAAAAALLDELLDDPLVACAHREPIFTPAAVAPPPPGDIPPTTPLFTSLQLAHGAPPNGLGVWRAQGVLGARGQGVTFHQVEYDWHQPHEDVSDLVPANFVGPVPSGTTAEANHGIAGASIVAADRNGYGMTGVADELAMRFYAAGANVPNTLLLVGANSQPGDVVLMVMMFLLGQLGTDDWVPMEFLQAVFDATLTLTAAGRVVVVTGANGGRSLDDPRFLRRFDRGYRDSGAIMISASQGGPMARAWFANFGSRIDGNGWGDAVVACGYGTLFHPNQDNRQAYTASYAGTSPAVPMVAGAIASLQGAARRQLERTLTSAEILQLLHTIGTPSPDAIGRRPDLWAMFQSLGIADGLELTAPDVALGGSASVLLSSAPNAAGFLFVSFTTGTLDLGLNRKVHLGTSTLQTVGFLPMPTGAANWTMQVPNDASLSGISLYFQAGVLQGSAPIHVTNSGQLTIL